MFRHLILIYATCVCFVLSNNFGPKYPPTKGAVWPKPKYQKSEITYYSIKPHNFNTSVTGQICDILRDAIERYAFFIRDFHRVGRRFRKRNSRFRRNSASTNNANHLGQISSMEINVQTPCTEYPFYGMDESYNLTVGPTRSVNLQSNSVWGALRGLETFTQLFYWANDETARASHYICHPCWLRAYHAARHYTTPSTSSGQGRRNNLNCANCNLNITRMRRHILNDDAVLLLVQQRVAPRMEIRINKTEIHDAPQYLHRGLLIDTSRHYISLGNILKTLDAMAMNKMNVLHWHIVDDQSFPYQSERFPDLSRLGAYHRSMVYTKDNIKMIINYARNRGIRVIPEFDVPGHTRSWGEAYPNILSGCYEEGVFKDFGPMNPIANVTYKLLQDLFTEVQEWFPDNFLHVGGDEVDLDCWRSDPSIQDYMKRHNISSVAKLHGLFMEKVIPLLGERSIPIVWQEVFDEGVPLNNKTLIQVWKGGEVYEMISILSAGHQIIYSSAWYLDHLKTGGDWTDFYKTDPRQLVVHHGGHNFDSQNIVGGEACMWGEVVDDTNIISRVWPRASAVAEKLWSPQLPYNEIPPEVFNRLEEHTCRMNRRGIRAQPPSGPGFCMGTSLV